jgi:hypothetical protein
MWLGPEDVISGVMYVACLKSILPFFFFIIKLEGAWGQE